jgi:hypothetical protein
VREHLKLNSEICDFVARNAKETMLAPVMGSGSVCRWKEYGVRRSVLCRCTWQESGFSRGEDLSKINLVTKILYKLHSVNEICKDGAAKKKCVTVQHEVPFPSTLTGHTLR